jgi:hypothetical protein
MLERVLCCAVAVFIALFTSAVCASPIEITAGDPGSLWPSDPTATVLTFDCLPVGQLPSYGFVGGSLTGNGAIEATSIPGKSAQPAGDPTNYLTVSYPSAAGEVFFTFSADENYFGLYWGSIDSYNTITFLNGNVQVASFSGTTVAALTGLVAEGNQQSPLSNRYINFYFDDDSFDAVVLSTTDFGFEVDNIAFGDPPAPIFEPSTLVLAGSFLCLIPFWRLRGPESRRWARPLRLGHGLATGFLRRVLQPVFAYGSTGAFTGEGRRGRR